jgi:hypothetical protein
MPDSRRACTGRVSSRPHRAEIAQHVEAAKGGLRFARRGGSVTFAHPFQPIRQVEQFLLDLRDLRLSCQLPNLLCNRAIIFTASFPLVAHRRILDRKRFPEEAGRFGPFTDTNGRESSRSLKSWLI